jgi:hypothetical protein
MGSHRRSSFMSDSGSNGVKKDAQGDTIGEGNYDATRRYRQGLEESVEKGNAGELAEKAKKALDGSEGDELRRAEEEAKKGKVPQK